MPYSRHPLELIPGSRYDLFCTFLPFRYGLRLCLTTRTRTLVTRVDSALALGCWHLDFHSGSECSKTFAPPMKRTLAKWLMNLLHLSNSSVSGCHAVLQTHFLAVSPLFLLRMFEFFHHFRPFHASPSADSNNSRSSSRRLFTPEGN